MPVDPAVIGPATLSVTQSLALFQSFLPKFTDIKNGSIHDPKFVEDVRLGEIAAASLSLGIGAIASAFTGSAVPIVVSIICGTGLIILYETALAHSPGSLNVAV